MKKQTSDNPSLKGQTAMEHCFGTVSKGDRGRKYAHAIEGCQCSIELVTGWLRFKELCLDCEEEFRAVLKREVVLRFVTDKPINEPLPRWISPRLPRYRFELRTLMNPPDAAVVIFDGKQAAIANDKNLPSSQGPDLWTTHPALVAMSQAYFYRQWGSNRH